MKSSPVRGLPAIFFSVLFMFIPVSLYADHRNNDSSNDNDATSTNDVSSAINSVTDTVTNTVSDAWGWGKSLGNTLALLGSDPVLTLSVPVVGVPPSKISDTWGDARSNGRSHEGIDIMAVRGTSVVSPTKAIVSSIGYGANGGNYVYTINPGGERYYYAHLDSYAPGLVTGKVLEPGDLIGYVGNTGNASGGAPHLHFGIYKGGALNPYPRLTLAASSTVAAIHTTNTTTNKAASAVSSVAQPSSLVRNLTLGMKGEDVKMLQKFLNAQGILVAQSGAGSQGNETTFFGPATQKALAKYQAANKINPAAGYFGPITRGAIVKELQLTLANR